MRILILIIGVLLSGQMAFSDEKGDSREEKYQVKLFGTKKSEPIKTGFFFYDGKYIPPPYVVKREGLAIKINHMVTCGPLPYFSENKIVIPKKMPEVPNTVKKDTDIDSEIVREFMYKVGLFVDSKYGEEKLRTRLKIIAQNYKKLPCVKNAYLISDREIQIEMNDGSSLVEISGFPGGGKRPLKGVDPKKQTLQLLDREYNEQLSVLKGNGLIVGMRSFIPVREENPCPGDLYEFVRILNSKKPFEEKVLSLKNGFAWRHTHDEEVLKIFSNYKYSKELTQRVETLYKKWKKDHPEEFKHYEIEKRRRPLTEQYNKISGRLKELEDKEEEFYIKDLEEEGKEYRENHKDERERLLEKLKELESKIERIK